MRIEEIYPRKSKYKIFYFDMSSNVYSNLKGYIGELIGAQFLAKHFNIKEYRCFYKDGSRCEMELPNPVIFPHQIIDPIKIEPDDIEYVSKQFYKENKNMLIKFLRELTIEKKYRYPDMFLPVEGKLYIVEVKMNKLELPKYQRDNYKIINEKYGYPVIILYITMDSFTNYTIEMEEL